MHQLAWLVKKKVQNQFSEASLRLSTGDTGVAAATKCDVCIGTATLELSSQSLEEQIRLFAKQAINQGCRRLKILPLFLLPGVHVMEDIPQEVAQAQLALGGEIRLELQLYLGANPGIRELVTQQMACTQVDVDKWILLAHGSRRPGALQAIEAIANHVGAVSAYWAVAPSWEQRVKELVSTGYKKIAILPYFLFPGGITDAIAHSVEEVKLQFPGVNLHLAQTLAASADLADLIGNVITDETHRTTKGEIFG
jgi:sirohydrochlorin ferrochelatase